MEHYSLAELAEQQLDRARQSPNGRSAETVYGGRDRVLGHVLLGLVAGATLAEHENPGDATVHVLRGRVRLGCGDSSQEGSAGELLIVPRARHSLDALDDAVVLLTIAKHGSH